MKSFEQFANEHWRKDNGFERLFSRYSSYVGRLKAAGDATALAFTMDKHQLRILYGKLLVAGTIEQTTESASKIVNKGIARYTQKILDAYDEEGLDSDFIDITGSGDDSSSIVDSDSKRVDVDSTSVVESEEEAIEDSSVKRRRTSTRIYETQKPSLSTTTAATAIDKVTTTSTVAPMIEDTKKRPEEETEAGLSKRRRVSFSSTVLYYGSEKSSESDMYDYNFLMGGGRKDSGLETPWMNNGVDISKDLMKFRDRVVQENYGISQPHEMLAVNFIFLLESENQTWGLQEEVHDHVWESMWDYVGKLRINNFESTTIVECHKWAGLAASNSFDEYSKLLRNEPPTFPLLRQVLLHLTSSQQLWTFSGHENEAAFIRYLIEPCLNATFGSIKHTSSKWTTVLNETRGRDSRLLIPDFSVVTRLRDRSCSLVHMEGKTAANKGLSQIWDDRTKLGQELKHTLDTMIVLEPSGPVSVIGILLTGYNLEFFEMTIQSEGVYIFKKYADCYLFNKAENMFPLCRLLEILETTKTMVERTLVNLRAVKIAPADTPLVPLSWRRPSFAKPRKVLLPD